MVWLEDNKVLYVAQDSPNTVFFMLMIIVLTVLLHFTLTCAEINQFFDDIQQRNAIL